MSDSIEPAPDPEDEPTARQPPLTPDIIESIQGNPQMLGIFAQIFTAQFSPLPSPEQLERYERVVPGSAKQILADASTQTHHRISLEKKVIGGNSKRSWVGLIVAGMVEAGVIAAVILAIIKNEAWTIPIFVAFGSLPAGTYYLSQRRQRLERQNKDAASQIPTPGSPERPYESS